MSSEKNNQQYFNISTGELIVGEAAMEDTYSRGCHPEDIFPLGVLLTENDRRVQAKALPAMPYEIWQSSFDVAHAKWLHSLTTNAETPKPISEEVITRAGYLGLSPRLAYFKKRPGGLSALYNEAELEGVRTRGSFDDWTTADYINYILDLANKLSDRPNFDDLVEAGRSIENPSVSQIARRFDGRLGTLFELAGWPDIKMWDIQDYIDWGVRFMIANDGQIPTAPHMRILTAKHLGPDPTTITYKNRFPSLLDYQTRVLESYNTRIETQQQAYEQRQKQIKLSVVEDKTLEQLLTGIDDEESTRMAFARYRVVRYFLPEASWTRVSHICSAKDTSSFVSKLTNTTKGEVSAGRIEVAASSLDVFDDLWPLDHYKQQLRIAA